MSCNSLCLDLDFKSEGLNGAAQYTPSAAPSSAIYLHCVRFAYLQLMKQGFNFLLPEINITLLEQMGGGRMGSMKKEQDNGVGSGTEWPEVIKLHNFHTLANSFFSFF